MTPPRPHRRFALPGGRITVETPTRWARSMAHGASLFGWRYRRLMRAAHGPDRAALHDAERSWCAAATAAIGLTVEVHGLDLVDPHERYVVLPLHESFVDLLALQHLPLEMAYTATEELLSWEYLGPYLQASGQATIPREDGPAGYRALLTAAHTAAVRGESPVVFPQGSVLGIEVAFHPGAFRLAERFELPVLPVVLTGGARVWDYPFSTTLRFGGTVRLEVLSPVAPTEAVASAGVIERRMKEVALAADPGPRRFDPERDGWWDGYRYEIDPRFPDVAEAVAQHRNATIAPGV